MSRAPGAAPSAAGAAASLRGVRVLDVSQEIAGPYAGKLLADLGAAVTKIEPPGGDRLRRWSATGEAFDPARDGGLHAHLNASKEIRTLDLARPDGRAAFLELLAAVDLVVEGNEPPFLDELGLGFDVLHAVNPALSLVTVSWFGRSGPFRDVPATDFTLQAWSGSIWSRGPEHLPPVHIGGRVSEWHGGAHAAAAALAAHRGTVDGARGRHVDLSLLEAAVTSLVSYPSVFRSFSGTTDPGGRKLDIPSIHRARDGWIGVCIVTGQQWLDFLVMVGRADLLDDPELPSWAGRSRRGDEVNGFVDAWMRTRTVAQVLAEAEAFRIPAAPIGNGATLLEFDHLRARHVFDRSPDGTYLAPRVPFHITSHAEPSAIPTTPSAARDPHRAGDDPLPLAGVRVLDLTAFVAGPMSTLYLASLGADVLKVESIQRPDPIRYYSVTTPEDPDWYERSPYFVAVNLGKRAITLNLADPKGTDALKRLIAEADIVVENFTPRVTDQFGLDAAMIHAVNPQAIFARLPAFGLDGPWRDRGGFAQTMEQVSGLAWTTGHRDGPPLVPGGMCDPLQAIHVAFGLIAALELRRRVGCGFQIEIPMVEVALNITAEQVIEHTRNARLLTRHGNRGPVAAPQGLYACADGRLLAVAARDDAEWDALVKVLDASAWAAAPELATVDGRHAHHDLLDEHLARGMAARDLDDVLAELLRSGVPCAPVLPGGLLESNPQLAARQFFEPVDQPVVGRHAFPGWPLGRCTWGRPWFASPSPLFDQHTADVLRGELALSEEEIAQLEAAGVTGHRPRGLDA